MLTVVSEAVFCNPFSARRGELDRSMESFGAHAHGREQLDRMMAQVGLGAPAAAREGEIRPVDVRHYSAPDRELVEHGLLFVLFHRYSEAFDAHIRQQIETGDEPCTLEIGDELMRTLIAHGFDQEAALRYLAIFYQMHRAYHFIDGTLRGRGRSMQRLRELLWASVFTHDVRRYDRYLWNRMEDFSTILLGETGTGKGTAAAAIGRSGYIPYDRRRKRFVESFTRAFSAINLSQFPESLLESELFGHRKGAFTGAVEAHQGVFERCSAHGAIFLDEIGEVCAPVQIKLLNVLQERSFTPVGSHESRRFSGRVIAATNRSLDELRLEGRFRDDFYYRLCSDVIEVPTLQERFSQCPEELDELLEHVLKVQLGEAPPELVTEIGATIGRSLGPKYAWPGNVRELEQCVRRVLLRKEYVGDHSRTLAGPADRLRQAIERGDATARELQAAYCKLLHQRFGTYEEVSRRTGLDRRTVKKYVSEASIAE
jgi:transcriptional regulator with AAA-type ATPase domain